MSTVHRVSHLIVLVAAIVFATSDSSRASTVVANATIASAVGGIQTLDTSDFETLQHERFGTLLGYVSPNGTRGPVAVTLSSYNHEYDGWTWVRDGALIMREVGRRFMSTNDPQERSSLLARFNDYVDFSRVTQNNAGLKNLGEPRFDFAGQPFQGPWGRPQTDGPAIRILTLVPVAFSLLHSTESVDQALLKNLYQAEPATNPRSVLKRDLEYVASVYQDKSHDLWEEKRGHHFYTLMAQRAALLQGAKLAVAMQDPFAADYYEKSAAQISQMLENYWDESRQLIVAARDVEPWRHDQNANIDVAVLLATLHSGLPGQTFYFYDSRMMITALRLEETFRPLYEINQFTQDTAGQPIGPAIGRYPEDVYNGNPIEALRYTGGHPWVLATFAMAEYYFKLAGDFAQTNSIEINYRNLPFFQALMPNDPAMKIGAIAHNDLVARKLAQAATTKGLSFWRRVLFHLDPHQPFSEMINRKTGQRESIPSLAWSDAACLSMMAAYRDAQVALTH